MTSRSVLAVLCVTGLFMLERQLLADELFEKPIRLSADGEVIDTGEQWGHSSPCFEDLDGDGLTDLLLGDFGGKFRVYRNVGQPGKPAYKDAGLLKADGQDASVRIYCCVGGQPRFVDLDGDGIRDFISSSYDPGHCYFFRGLADHKFASSKELTDKAGVPVRSRPQQNHNYDSFGSFYTPVDWDADGDFDILIGCFGGELKLRINEGSASKAVFADDNLVINAGESPLKVEAHCCPVIADWDGDGRWDIISGCDDGSVTWFRNVGTKQMPQLEKGVVLVEKSPSSGYNLLRWSDEEIVPGIRSQVDVVDYNNDGKLDLLVGDFCSAFHPKKDLGEAGREKLVSLIGEMEAISKPFADKMKALREDFARRFPGDAITSDEADRAWTEEYQALRTGPEYKAMEKNEASHVRKIRPLLEKTRGNGDRSFDLANSHGYVWLFTRK